jgi:hypothetical protein
MGCGIRYLVKAETAEVELVFTRLTTERNASLLRYRSGLSTTSLLNCQVWIIPQSAVRLVRDLYVLASRLHLKACHGAGKIALKRNRIAVSLPVGHFRQRDR